ncbi:MAG: GIDE domain-containing protein, partial [Planctomycetota bacterium]|nr:GIDE domain-containing protein [Planctomycetota bacterium]
MDQTIRGTTTPAYRRLLLALVFPLLLGGGLLLQEGSLTTVRNIHKLERLPMSPIKAAIPGVIKTTGEATRVAGQSLLKATWTETPCLWYRAVKQRKTTDSDGRTSWETVSEEQDGTPYLLADDSDRIMVHPDLDQVDVSLERKWARTDGSLRYREWRIDPGDRIIVVGTVRLEAGSPQIILAGGGEYLPIITDRPIKNLRGNMGLHAVLMIVGSVFCVAASCVCLMLALRIHNTLAFITISGLLQACLLLVGGTLMIASDLKGADRALAYSTEAARTMVESKLAAQGVVWSGDWSDETVFDRETGPKATHDSINAIRSALAARTSRTIQLQDRFPQWLVARAIDVPPPVRIPGIDSTAVAATGRIEAAAISWIWPTIGMSGSLLTGLVCGVMGLSRVKVKRLIENIPTTPCAEVEIGVTEIIGHLKAGSDEEAEPLLGPLTEEPCLWFRYHVQEWRGSGKNRRLVTIEDTTRFRSMVCEDDTGAIPLMVKDAEIITGRAPKRSRGKRVYTEHSLREGDPLYVLGSGEIDPKTGDSLRVERDPQKLPYIISNLPEKRLKTMKISAAFWLLAFAVAGAASFILFGTLFSGGVGALDELLAALGAIGMMGFCMVIILYND